MAFSKRAMDKDGIARPRCHLGIDLVADGGITQV
jgi:hypothetical protein